MTDIDLKNDFSQIRAIFKLAWKNIYYLIFFIIIFEIIAFYFYTNYTKRTVSHEYRVNYIFFEPTDFLQQQNRLLKIMSEDIAILFSTSIFSKRMYINEELTNPSFTIIKNLTELRGILPTSEINKRISAEFIIQEIVKDFSFDNEYFISEKLQSKKIENLNNAILFNFFDNVDLAENYETLLDDYLLDQSKIIFNDFKKSYLNEIDIKIIQINNIISFFNSLKIDDGIAPIQKLSIDHPIFVPFIDHINNFYSDIDNFPLKFFEVNNISEFPNLKFLPYFMSFLFFAIITFIFFVFIKTLYKALNDKKS